jgi:hypothetical protein
VKRALVWSVSLIVLAALTVSVLWRFLVRPEPPPPDVRGIRIQVFNGCGVPRLARAVSNDMGGRGFDVYEVGNEPEHHAQTTVVDLADPAASNARKVADALSVRQKFLGLPIGRTSRPVVQVDRDTTSFFKVRLVVGEDYQLFFPDVRPLH